jgi:hypothetical protein
MSTDDGDGSGQMSVNNHSGVAAVDPLKRLD